MRFLNRISFSSPKRSDIIIFDECNFEYLKAIISADCSVTIINQRPPNYFISYKLIKLFLSHLKYFSIADSLNHQKSIIIGFIFQLRLIYYRSLIALINPKAIITSIDNNQIFNQLSKYLKEFPFIAIQNGLRLVHEKARNYHVQHLFSFGNNESTYFKNIGYEVENFYPSGSLIASLYFKNFKLTNNCKYDILITSCWRGNIGYPIDQVDSMNSMREMDTLLSKYIKKNNIKAAVSLRNERNGEHWFVPEIGKNEEEYFYDIYGNCVDLIDVDFKSRNIYSLINQSELIVSGFSTSVLVEAYGYQKKIMYYNFTNKDIYHSIFDTSIVSNKSDFGIFSNELDQLIKIKQSDYLKQHSLNMKHYMSFPENDNYIEYVSNRINQIIEKNNEIIIQ